MQLRRRFNVNVHLPICTFHHCIRTINCVILTMGEYHQVVIVRNLQATYHENTYNICYGKSAQYAVFDTFLSHTSLVINFAKLATNR